MANKFDFAEVSNEKVEEVSDTEVAEYKQELKDKDFVACTDSFKTYLKELGRYDLLTPEQEIAYAKDYRETQNPEAKAALVNHNLRLVVNIAKRFVGAGIPIQDLVQEGNLGLMRAVDMYDPDKGFRFSTYATWWIKQAVTRAIANDGRTIRLPVHAYEALRKYQKFERDWKANNPGVALPSDEEIMKKLDISEVTYKLVTSYHQDVVSLSTPIGEEQDSTIGDFIADDNMSIEDYADYIDLKETIKSILNSDAFNDRERGIVIKRFGLDGGSSMTLEQVGALYGVTRERIRQIECKAIRKLRHPSRARLLKGYLEK